MSRPKIDIKWETSDYLIEELALAGLVALIVVPVYYYFQLPDQVPIHFGIDGKADAYGSKTMIWLLPLIGGILYIMMTVTNRYPHIFNYPVKINEGNAYNQYKNATRLIRILKAIITVSFAYIIYAQIQSAQGNQSGLGNYFIPVFLVIILSNTGYYLYKSSRM